MAYAGAHSRGGGYWVRFPRAPRQGGHHKTFNPYEFNGDDVDHPCIESAIESGPGITLALCAPGHMRLFCYVVNLEF